MTSSDPRGRILTALSEGAEDPLEVAMILVDEDVAQGLYEGCSSELDLAASEYIAVALNVIAEREEH